MLIDNIFANTIDKLLSGVFVCPISSPEEFHFLGDELNREKVDRHLRQTGKILSTVDDELYYCSYVSLNSEKQKHCKSIVKEVESQLRPIVDFLSLNLRCHNNDTALYTGDVISLTVLVSKIEHDKSHQKSLDRLTILTKSRPKDSVLENVKQIIKYLVGCDILIQQNANLGTYCCTGKLAYVLSLMEFIRSNSTQQFSELVDDEPQQYRLS